MFVRETGLDVALWSGSLSFMTLQLVRAGGRKLDVDILACRSWKLVSRGLKDHCFRTHLTEIFFPNLKIGILTVLYGLIVNNALAYHVSTSSLQASNHLYCGFEFQVCVLIPQFLSCSLHCTTILPAQSISNLYRLVLYLTFHHLRGWLYCGYRNMFWKSVVLGVKYLSPWV